MGQAKSEASAILAEARKRRRGAARARPRGGRGRPPAPARGDAQADRGRDGRALEQIRAEVADLTLDRDREGDRQGARPGRPQAADRGRDRRPRLLRAGARAPSSGRRAPHVRPVALPGGQGAGKLDVVHAELGDFAAAVDEVPELRGLLYEPGDRPRRAAGGAARDPRRRRRAASATSSSCSSEKGRAAQLDEIYREFDALVAAEAGRLTVELTTAYELSDDEAASIVKKIEQSSGRTVEATRAVDPA